MERFEEARSLALKNLKVADHIVTVTYPLVKDTKLLIGVLDNLFLALSHGIAAILWYKRLHKYIPPFNDNFESKFNLFRVKCVGQHGIDKQLIDMIREIKETILLHRKSKVEFRKKDCFVICGDNYSMTAITVNKMKMYVKRTKEFVRTMETIVNERIPRRSTRRIEAR